tara:strand:- start:1533 stop:1757 length:225 start_codon:yes stop_codon:yes gene_type:complete
MNIENRNAWSVDEENVVKALDRLERKSDVMRLTLKHDKVAHNYHVEQMRSDWDEVLSLVMIAKRGLGLKSITQK